MHQNTENHAMLFLLFVFQSSTGVQDFIEQAAETSEKPHF